MKETLPSGSHEDLEPIAAVYTSFDKDDMQDDLNGVTSPEQYDAFVSKWFNGGSVVAIDGKRHSQDDIYRWSKAFRDDLKQRAQATHEESRAAAGIDEPVEQASTYKRISATTKDVVIGTRRGANSIEYPVAETVDKPLNEVEVDLVKDTDRLIGMMDGSIGAGDGYLDKGRRHDGPVEAAIYLDKSARPVRALTHELWSTLASEEASEPKASFLNIDKKDWLTAMGFSAYEVAKRYIAPRELDLGKIDQDFLLNRVARIRALYLEDRSALPDLEEMFDDVEAGRRPTEDLLKIWDMPTLLDDKHVAVVDEVQSSKATLVIADMLLSRAFPDAQLEPMFWSTPSVTKNEFEDPKLGLIEKIGDTEKPLWYQANNPSGRGGIADKFPNVTGRPNDEVTKIDNPTAVYTPELRQYNQSARRIGKYILSTPYKRVMDKVDTEGMEFRKDFRTLAQRLKDGEIDFQQER